MSNNQKNTGSWFQSLLSFLSQLFRRPAHPAAGSEQWMLNNMLFQTAQMPALLEAFQQRMAIFAEYLKVSGLAQQAGIVGVQGFAKDAFNHTDGFYLTYKVVVTVETETGQTTLEQRLNSDLLEINDLFLGDVAIEIRLADAEELKKYGFGKKVAAFVEKYLAIDGNVREEILGVAHSFDDSNNPESGVDSENPEIIVVVQNESLRNDLLQRLEEGEGTTDQFEGVRVIVRLPTFEEQANFDQSKLRTAAEIILNGYLKEYEMHKEVLGIKGNAIGVGADNQATSPSKLTLAILVKTEKARLTLLQKFQDDPPEDHIKGVDIDVVSVEASGSSSNLEEESQRELPIPMVGGNGSGFVVETESQDQFDTSVSGENTQPEPEPEELEELEEINPKDIFDFIDGAEDKTEPDPEDVEDEIPQYGGACPTI